MTLSKFFYIVRQDSSNVSSITCLTFFFSKNYLVKMSKMAHVARISSKHESNDDD
jgi:hypothetical protein